MWEVWTLTVVYGPFATRQEAMRFGRQHVKLWSYWVRQKTGQSSSVRGATA